MQVFTAGSETLLKDITEEVKPRIQQIMDRYFQDTFSDAEEETSDPEAELRYQEYLKEVEENEKKMAVQRHLNYCESCCIPKKFYDESFSTYNRYDENDERNYNAVLNFAKNPKDKLLLMYGNNGTGKTHLGTSVLQECKGIYIQSMKLCIEYETGANFNAKRNKLEVLDYYSTTPMLVIDEIGRCNKEAVEKEILPYIINQRYENQLPTVLITNMDKKDIVDYLGRAIYDRMTEICVSVEFKGQSHRAERREKEI